MMGTEQRRRKIPALFLNKKRNAILALIAVLLLGVLIVLAAVEFSLQASPLLRVGAKVLNVRAEPSSEAEIVGVLYAGEQVEILQRDPEGTFVYITTGHGLQGWCAQAYLRRQGMITNLYLELLSPRGGEVYYSPDTLLAEIKALAKKYPQWVRYEKIGESVWGQPLWQMTLGNPDAEKCILVQGGIHAREYATARLTVDMARRLLEDCAAQVRYESGSTAEELLKQVRLVFIPLNNPDGALLCQQGISAAPKALRQELIAMNKGFTDFSRWKANGRGVDLNANFDARWEPNAAYPAPGSSGYRGAEPFSEPESIALREVVQAEAPDRMLCYHSSGQIIYWYFGQQGEALERDEALALQLGALTGYRLGAAQEPVISVAGSKDWFVQEYGLPGFTMEIFDSSVMPATEEMYKNEADKHMQILPWLMEQVLLTDP